MNMPVLSEMEDSLTRLSLAEQLWLMERLVQHIRERTVTATSVAPSNDLAAMAADPQIQRELRLIEEEFALTEADGLDISL